MRWAGRTFEFELRSVGGGTLTVADAEDGHPGAIFLRVAKQGSTLAGLCDSLAVATSVALNAGTPLAELTDRLRHIGPGGSETTGDPEIPSATSLPDYMARRLAAA